MFKAFELQLKAEIGFGAAKDKGPGSKTIGVVEKNENQKISSERVVNENMIGSLKGL